MVSIILALSELGNISAFVKNFVNSVVKKPDGFDLALSELSNISAFVKNFVNSVVKKNELVSIILALSELGNISAQKSKNTIFLMQYKCNQIHLKV